jgi:protein-S-isoprenylcysteine O-methyltransferase Ste14
LFPVRRARSEPDLAPAQEAGLVIFILARAATYSSLFIGLLLIYLPERILSSAGISQPATIGFSQAAGILLGTFGAAVAVACILAFVAVGRGTPAPFDPPRRLVVRGPYRFVRNPMYLGAGLALTGAALFYQSAGLAGYVAVFFVITHLFVLLYEEPTLQRSFEGEYRAYCRRVGRWWPRLRERS